MAFFDGKWPFPLEKSGKQPIIPTVDSFYTSLRKTIMAKQIRIISVATAAMAVVCAAVSSCQLPGTLGLRRPAPSADNVTQSPSTPLVTEGGQSSSSSTPQPLFGTGTVTLPAGSEPLATTHSNPPIFWGNSAGSVPLFTVTSPQMNSSLPTPSQHTVADTSVQQTGQRSNEEILKQNELLQQQIARLEDKSKEDLDKYAVLSQKLEQLTTQMATLTAVNNGNVANVASEVKETASQVVARPIVKRKFPSVAGVEDVSDDREVRIRIDDGEVYTSGTYDLLPTAKDTLLKVARVLKEEFPSAKLRIESHTDDFSGTKLTVKEILNISTEKARQVADVLVELQLYRSADLQVNGVGAGVPIADNTTAEGRRKNNRIELVLR